MGDNLARYTSLRRVLGETLFAMGDNLGRYASLRRVVDFSLREILFTRGDFIHMKRFYLLWEIIWHVILHHVEL